MVFFWLKARNSKVSSASCFSFLFTLHCLFHPLPGHYVRMILPYELTSLLSRVSSNCGCVTLKYQLTSSILNTSSLHPVVVHRSSSCWSLNSHPKLTLALQVPQISLLNLWDRTQKTLVWESGGSGDIWMHLISQRYAHWRGGRLHCSQTLHFSPVTWRDEVYINLWQPH